MPFAARTSIETGGVSRGADTDRSRGGASLWKNGDVDGDAEPSVNGVVGESGNAFVDDFQPKKVENLLVGVSLRLEGEMVWPEPMLPMLLSEIDLERPSWKTGMSGAFN